jgi:hypothetical protein
LFDWMKFGLPFWFRLVGFPLGIIALTVPKRPGRAALLFGLSCALLAASWPVALMAVRGWARSSFASPAEVTLIPSEIGFDPRKLASTRQELGSIRENWL